MRRNDNPVHVRLTDEQRDLLMEGLGQWGGPAHASDGLAVAMGFTDHDSMIIEAEGLVDAINQRRPLTPRDWTRALLATEIAWASDVVGATGEWELVTGDDDHDVVDVLRSSESAAGCEAARGLRWAVDLLTAGPTRELRIPDTRQIDVC